MLLRDGSLPAWAETRHPARGIQGTRGASHLEPVPAKPDAPNIHWLIFCCLRLPRICSGFRIANAVFALGALLVQIRLVDVIRRRS
jgi:hypothetical protein